jgi:hypothetical protein
MKSNANAPPRNDERRVSPARHQKLLSAKYRALSLVANIFGSVFWVVEQRRWKIADQLENLETGARR